MVRDHNAPQKHVWRAESVLLTAEGVGTNENHAPHGRVQDLHRWQNTGIGVPGATAIARMRRWRHSLVIEKRNERACKMRSVPLMAIPLLLQFTESLDVRFAVRIEEFLAAFLPRRFEFGCCDVPVWSAFFSNSA